VSNAGFLLLTSIQPILLLLLHRRETHFSFTSTPGVTHCRCVCVLTQHQFLSRKHFWNFVVVSRSSIAYEPAMTATFFLLASKNSIFFGGGDIRCRSAKCCHSTSAKRHVRSESTDWEFDGTMCQKCFINDDQRSISLEDQGCTPLIAATTTSPRPIYFTPFVIIGCILHQLKQI
jgi:hypothetical protein